MAYGNAASGHGPNTAGMYEGGLEEGAIFSDHNRQGKWADMGQTEACWELPHMSSVSEGDSRHIVATHSPDWNSTVIVTTGMTRGDNGSPSTPMYDSEFPNH